MISFFTQWTIFALESINSSGLPGAPGPNNPNQNAPATNTDTPEIALIIQVVFGIIGGLAVLFVTLSGLRYITAAGDPQRMQQAKEGIIYALVGIAIAVAAEAIVAFVLGQL